MIGSNRIAVGIDLGAGTDLTPGSALAVERARGLARQSGASITLLHSTAADEHWEPSNGDMIFVAHGLSPQREAAVAAVAESLCAEGIDTEIEYSDDKAWLAIIRRVLVGDIDLVVIGKRSHYEMAPSRLGSVSTKIVRMCPCPVWTVKDAAPAVPSTIVGAVDLDGLGELVIRTTVELGARFQANVHLVLSFQIPMDVQLSHESGAYVSKTRAERVEAMKAITEACADAPPRYRCHAVPTSPTRAIEAAVDEFGADLVVMGSIGRGGLPGLLTGNTAERLLTRLPCSLLVVKPDDFVCPVDAPRAGT